MTISNRSQGIDLIKFFAAFLIVLIHSDWFIGSWELLAQTKLAGRWVVPFFFIVSGFYLGKKITDNSSFDFKLIEKNITSLISVTLVANFIFTIVLLIEEKDQISFQQIIAGTYYHLWFLGSLTFGYLGLWYIYKLNWQKILPFISIIILCFFLWGSSYISILDTTKDYRIPRFFSSIAFMYFGILLSRLNISKKLFIIALTTLIVGFTLQSVEIQLLKIFFGRDKLYHELLIGTILIAPSFFIIANYLNLKQNLLSKIGNKYALFLYLYHPFIIFIYKLILNNIPNNSGDQIESFIKPISPIFYFCITLFLGIILNRFLPRLFQILNGKLTLQ